MLVVLEEGCGGRDVYYFFIKDDNIYKYVINEIIVLWNRESNILGFKRCFFFLFFDRVFLL